VLQAKELAAAGEPVAVIAERLEVSTRTVRRYLQVEIEETTVHPSQERPQLFAVADRSDRSEGLEVVNG
jgi:DNA-binding NarL/FixJ family response regulator